MSISITINGRKIIPPQSSSCASSLYVLGHAFYAATPKKGMHTNRIEVSKEDRRILFSYVESSRLWVSDSLSCIGTTNGY